MTQLQYIIALTYELSTAGNLSPYQPPAPVVVTSILSNADLERNQLQSQKQDAQ
jgi:hypothetical protein